MPITRTILIALLLMLAACARQAHSPPDLYVMRHLHTPGGVSDPDLTEEGRRTAGHLATWFTRDPPAVIYVSRPKRAQQTAAPLALRLGLTPIVYDPADTPALIAAVSKETRTVLIVGHSNTVPDIIARLGGQRPAPLTHDDFGDIWKIDGRTRATAQMKIAP